MALFVPLVIGFVSVLQATLNRQVARAWGLGPMALLNMVVAFCIGAAFVVYCLMRGSGEGAFRVSFDLSLFRMWWLLPGCFGCAIVFGLPWAVEKLGALPVFVMLVGAQMCASAVWDRMVEGAPLSTPRVLGALLAVVSAVLVNWK